MGIGDVCVSVICGTTSVHMLRLHEFLKITPIYLQLKKCKPKMVFTY